MSSGFTGTMPAAAMAIKQGIAPDGGLLVPAEIPAVSIDEIVALTNLDDDVSPGAGIVVTPPAIGIIPVVPDPAVL